MVVAVNSLALEERVEKLKTQYFSEGKDKSLDEKGKSHLHSLLDDFGYEETNGIFCRTSNNSVDIFVERNLGEKKGGFTYLCLTSPTETLKFQERYFEYLNDRDTCFGSGLLGGLIVGVIGGICTMLSSIETYTETKKFLFEKSSEYSTLLVGESFFADTSFLVAFSLPIVFGGVIGGIYSHNWKNDKEKNDKEFQERYLTADKKYTTGKMAVESALSSSS